MTDLTKTPTTPLRVVQIAASSRPGGAESFYLRMVAALHAHPEVEQMPVVRTGSWLAARLEAENIPHRTLPFGGLLDFKTRPALTQLIKEFNPAIVQSWMNRAARFTPAVENVARVGRLGGYYNLKYYRTMNHLVGNTEAICTYIKTRGWQAASVSYIPNFVDLPQADFRGYRHDVRAEYVIPDHAHVVLMAGRLHENKGFDQALYALKYLPEDVHMLIAGSGPQHSALKAAVEADGYTSRVHFVGWINKMSPLYAAADVFLHPARHEPLGNIILEAWAHGLPVVATATDGPRSLITHEETGLLVPLGDDKAMAESILRLIDHPELADRMTKSAAVELHGKFSREAVVDQYLGLYRNLVEQQGA